jgi:kumamolisin
MFTLTANRKRKTWRLNPFRHCRLACALALVLAAPGSALAAPNLDGVLISGHIPTHALATAKHLGRVAPTERLSLALTLPLRNQAALDDLLKRLYDPNDPLHGKYLTTQQFQDQFSPTQADYDKVITYARAQGFLVKGLHANRTLLDVEAPASVVESVFHLQMHRYQAQNGRQFYAPDAEPMLPAEIAPHLGGVIGLDNAAVPEPNLHGPIPSGGIGQPQSGIGSGPNGGLTPSDIKTAYGLSNTALNGTGETLALFELNGYAASDITAYEQQFGLPAVPLQNVLIDGFAGNPIYVANGKDVSKEVLEVTQNIELMTALAPHARKILVYEGPNSGDIASYDLTIVHIFDRIASDNLAREISSSWSTYEQYVTTPTINSENAAFQQMAAQGQSIFVASGDTGATAWAYDPASQPYVVSVGGTTLRVNSNHTYQSETTWNHSGGAISAIWSRPNYQTGVGASNTMRNFPDVALNADPNTGYAIYQGGWLNVGGTSCAAPLWAAFAALVNQQRIANGTAPLGFANPDLYAIAESANYSKDWHDIADNSSNGLYKATTGYDNATGWGSFNGTYLLHDLTRQTHVAYVSVGLDNDTRLLNFYNDSSISIRRIDPNGNVLNFRYYGPYVGWTPVGIATGPDNSSHVLWDNTSGQISIWTLDSTGANTSYKEYGPYTGQTAKSISIGPDNITHVLWDYSSGEIGLWNVDASLNFLSSTYFGPYTGWIGNRIAIGPDNHTRLQWTYTDGTIALWDLDAKGNLLVNQHYGPYSGWTVHSMSVGADNITRLLWDTGTTISLWNVDANMIFQHNHLYGPFTGWTGASIATGPDSDSHIAWVNPDSRISLWTMDPSGNYLTYHYYSP